MKSTRVICPDCGKEVTKSNLSKHRKTHQRVNVSSDAVHVCRYCKQEFKLQDRLTTHEKLCTSNPNRQEAYQTLLKLILKQD